MNNGDNPHGAPEAWKYLARMLNELPATRWTATALENFLRVWTASFPLYFIVYCSFHSSRIIVHLSILYMKLIEKAVSIHIVSYFAVGVLIDQLFFTSMIVYK